MFICFFLSVYSLPVVYNSHFLSTPDQCTGIWTEWSFHTCSFILLPSFSVTASLLSWANLISQNISFNLFYSEKKKSRAIYSPTGSSLPACNVMMSCSTKLERKHNFHMVINECVEESGRNSVSITDAAAKLSHYHFARRTDLTSFCLFSFQKLLIWRFLKKKIIINIFGQWITERKHYLFFLLLDSEQKAN